MESLPKNVLKRARLVVILMLSHMAVIACWIAFEIKRMNLDVFTILGLALVIVSIPYFCGIHAKALITELNKARR